MLIFVMFLTGLEYDFVRRKLLFVNGSVDIVWQNGVAFWGVELIFHGRSDDEFDRKILDQGYNILVDGKRVPYPDKHKNSSTTPGLLNAGAVATLPQTLTFKDHREADLNALFAGL